MAKTPRGTEPTHVLSQNIPQRSFVRPFHGHDFCGLVILRRPLLSHIRQAATDVRALSLFEPGDHFMERNQSRRGIAMKKENRWTRGIHHFVVPPLSDALTGRHGCSLQTATFDESVGEEVYALYLEEPAYADQFNRITPFNMVVRFGLVRTPYGVVAFIVWLIAAGSHHEVTTEQYLNPQNIDALRLVASAANQTHFKLLIVDNQSSEVGAFIDFENVFKFDQLASTMATAIGHEPEGDFGAAMEYAMNTWTVQELSSCLVSPD